MTNLIVEIQYFEFEKSHGVHSARRVTFQIQNVDSNTNTFLLAK